MHTNRYRTRTVTVDALVSSKFFRQGASEYHSGKWSEIVGCWYTFSAAEIYERGRLVAAFTGSIRPSAADYARAKAADAMPTSTQRKAA